MRCRTSFERGLLLLLVVMSGAIVSTVVDGQEASWEFFRGPNFDGRSAETGLENSWPEQGPPVLWARELGQGYSSFVGQGGRIFTQYQTVTSQFVICLDADTGKTLWQHGCGWSYDSMGLYPGPRSTPTISGDKLYATTPQGDLKCLAIEDGRLIWEVPMIKKFGAKPVDFGYACSPVIVGDKVVLPVGGKGAALVAFDKTTGDVVWQSGDQEISYSSVLPIERAGRKLLVAYFKNKMVLFDSVTGKQLDELPISSGYDEHSAWPIYEEPNLWISGPFRLGSRMLRITDDDRPAMVDVWGSDVMSNDVCSSVLYEGHLFGFDLFDVQSKVHRPSRGSFRCIHFLTGKTRWENGSRRDRRDSRSPNTAIGHASLIIADGKLILLNDTGELILAEASHNGYNELGRASVLSGEICWTQPMLLGRRLYLRNQSRAVCVYLGDPADLDLAPEDLVTTSELTGGSYFNLASWIFSVEPEYAMDAPTAAWLNNWYWLMMLGGWGFAYPLAIGVSAIKWRRFNPQAVRQFTFYALAITFGLFGTTLLSAVVQDFVFTWPLVLAIVFEMVANQTTTRNPKVRGQNSPWIGRLVLFFFFVVCLAYFYLCRRLSLAFEWSFLLGFPAALPFLLIAKRGQNVPGWKGILIRYVVSALAFTAFYWLGAAVILWKY